MIELKEFLQKHAVERLLPGSCLDEACRHFALSHAEVERAALQAALLPARYQRNLTTLSVDQQLQLCTSRVSVVGCGGLGGYLIEQLARLGVGEIQIIDGDVFEEHNLNRQLYATTSVLGMSKVAVAARRVGEINPAITVVTVDQRLDGTNGDYLLHNAKVVADAVDNLDTRHQLARCCHRLGIPMVHGAIAGWYGHVTTIYPGDTTLEKLYPSQTGCGIERELGNPAFTPAVVASLQVAEVCKILLGKQGQLRNRVLNIDLLEMEVEELAF